MRTFSIQKRRNSPGVYIDEYRNLIEISGNSTLKEAKWFYGNVLKWIFALDNQSSQGKTVNIKLKNVNVSSSKWLSELFVKLNQKYPALLFQINWFSEGNNQEAKVLYRKMLNNPGLIVNVL